jgi:hypothetical protein
MKQRSANLILLDFPAAEVVLLMDRWLGVLFDKKVNEMRRIIAIVRPAQSLPGGCCALRVFATHKLALNSGIGQPPS